MEETDKHGIFIGIDKEIAHRRELPEYADITLKIQDYKLVATEVLTKEKPNRGNNY